MPGDQLRIEMKMLRLKTTVAKMQGVAKVDGSGGRGSDPDVQADRPRACAWFPRRRFLSLNWLEVRQTPRMAIHPTASYRSGRQHLPPS